MSGLFQVIRADYPAPTYTKVGTIPSPTLYPSATLYPGETVVGFRLTIPKPRVQT